MSATLPFTITTGTGLEFEHELPARFVVCPRCEGHGTHLNPSIGQHCYTAEEFRREFDDEEAAEYFKRGGLYDVSCEQCHGARVVAVVDEDTAQRTHRGRRLLNLYRTNERRLARDRRERESEIRFGY